MGLVRWLAGAAALLGCTLAAEAASLSYVDFISLPTPQRVSYIAGAYDQFVTIYAPPAPGGSGFEAFVQHIAACVRQHGIDAEAMQTGLMAFAITRVDLQAGPIPILLMEYLIAECGLPATD